MKENKYQIWHLNRFKTSDDRSSAERNFFFWWKPPLVVHSMVNEHFMLDAISSSCSSTARFLDGRSRCHLLNKVLHQSDCKTRKGSSTLFLCGIDCSSSHDAQDPVVVGYIFWVKFLKKNKRFARHLTCITSRKEQAIPIASMYGIYLHLVDFCGKCR